MKLADYPAYGMLMHEGMCSITNNTPNTGACFQQWAGWLSSTILDE